MNLTLLQQIGIIRFRLVGDVLAFCKGKQFNMRPQATGHRPQHSVHAYIQFTLNNISSRF
jgi:hypothetical protein